MVKWEGFVGKGLGMISTAWWGCYMYKLLCLKRFIVLLTELNVFLGGKKLGRILSEGTDDQFFSNYICEFDWNITALNEIQKWISDNVKRFLDYIFQLIIWSSVCCLIYEVKIWSLCFNQFLWSRDLVLKNRRHLSPGKTHDKIKFENQLDIQNFHVLHLILALQIIEQWNINIMKLYII